MSNYNWQADRMDLTGPALHMTFNDDSLEIMIAISKSLRKDGWEVQMLKDQPPLPFEFE